ncbi:LemA family protein [Olsenella sp. YH-ols2217]|uniref:LemA family protein n=1 Tax=Kribbibacterium absianum TaxID=3044210 RepID=A0ABT6ZJ66_9ACTN|nr:MULTISPECIES: LemA family protein [unclassified Olsenella]MDJ1122660.1 LemA family protein [Olsenella sp. YH-ols2216]MDJ1129098.1 LemA family protein [Olsenella sp. YH-ols2217]
MAFVIVILVISVMIIVALVSTYNGMVQKRNRVDNAWQNIDANLQRRNDLVPNLVETVKGYAAHEQGVLQAVTEARAAVAGAKTPQEAMEGSEQLTGALRQLMAVAEAYPDLKANTSFINLQDQLADTENRLTYARQSYNDCVLMYNNAIQSFPGNLLAGAGGFTAKDGFTVSDESVRQTPTVKF